MESETNQMGFVIELDVLSVFKGALVKSYCLAEIGAQFHILTKTLVSGQC